LEVQQLQFTVTGLIEFVEIDMQFDQAAEISCFLSFFFFLIVSFFFLSLDA